MTLETALTVARKCLYGEISAQTVSITDKTKAYMVIAKWHAPLTKIELALNSMKPTKD
jgi:hypothetical protein